MSTISVNIFGKFTVSVFFAHFILEKIYSQVYIDPNALTSFCANFVYFFGDIDVIKCVFVRYYAVSQSVPF